MSWVIAAAFLSCAVNGAQIVYNWRLMRRWQRLDKLMFQLCWQAFSLRHAPLWQAWSDAMGRKMRVRVETARPD